MMARVEKSMVIRLLAGALLIGLCGIGCKSSETTVGQPAYQEPGHQNQVPSKPVIITTPNEALLVDLAPNSVTTVVSAHAAAAAALDINNLSYKFTYAGKTAGGPLKFKSVNGQYVGNCEFKDIPTGKTDKLTLEIAEANVVKYRGELPNLTVKPNEKKTVQIQMHEVDDGTPSQTHLDIEVITGKNSD